MKKNDYILLAVLLALLFTWPTIDRLLSKHVFKNAPRPVATAASNQVAAAMATNSADALAPAAVPADTAVEAAPAPTPAATAAGETASTNLETRVTLANERIALEFGSRGASLASAVMASYRSALAKDSPPMRLDFSSSPALAYHGLPGLGLEHDFQLTVAADGRKLTAERRTAGGLRLTRTIELGERYELGIVDTLANESGQAVALTNVAVRTGPMRRELGHKDMTGFVSLGIDSLSPGGHDVMHWGSKLAKQFDLEHEERGLPKLPVRLARVPEMKTEAIDWVAAKNKYFVQILTPEEGADGLVLHAQRELTPAERSNPDLAVKMTPIEEVAAAAVFASVELAPGAKQERRYSYYIGPKKLAELGKLTLHRDEVMEIGDWLKPISKVLLRTLNAIHSVLPNYGVAIMLLTIIIRVVFWPITHKSSQSMKRMAELQPLVKEVQAKYQKDPQRMQAEMMKIYKEHKVNPVAGCLPMLIQIPFFFALFLVLRSAIELRFAPFLWISDLSEPENLFANVIGFPLNILPLLMAGTMYWQQKITPTAGDPQQAKMMRIMMTGMMLFFLYSYAAGLALYWTTQNLLMIGQQLWMQRKKKTA